MNEQQLISVQRGVQETLGLKLRLVALAGRPRFSVWGHVHHTSSRMVRFSDEGAASSGDRPSQMKSATRQLGTQPSRKEAASGMKAALGITAQQVVGGSLESQPSGLKREGSAVKRELSAQPTTRALRGPSTMVQREVNRYIESGMRTRMMRIWT